MPVNSTHPLYDAALDAWRRCRDCYAGEDAVKARGKTYLPMLGGQDKGEYDSYRMRASYYEAVGRTVDGFVGAIARKDPEITLPAKLAPLLDSATVEGLSLPEFVKRLCAEAMLIGRGAVLVDFDAEQNRPYLALYTAENVINWRPDRVVLTETVYEPDPDDDFKMVAIDQCRELAMDGGRYVARIWRRPNNADPRGQDWTVYRTIEPTSRGKPLTEIPFFWITPLGKTDAIVKPPLLGLVNISLAHYRTSADLEHGRHFSGLPTLYVTGMDPETAPQICVGSTAALILPDPAAKVGYADFSGQGLGSLENALAEREHQMAVLGAAVFADGKKGVEAAETARIRSSGETSLLMGVVQAAEACLTAALTTAAEWSGAAGDVSIELNRDFVDTSLDPQALQGLVAAYQAGALTIEQLLWNLQAGEMLAPDTDLDEEAAKMTAAADKKAAAAAATARASAPKMAAPSTGTKP